MFETAELGQKISKSEFKQREPQLWSELLDAQRQIRKHGRFPVLIDFAGVHGAGKMTTINLLNKWMDPRWIRTHAFDRPSENELTRPEFWRYWRYLPPRGQIGLYLSGRYSRPLLDFVHGRIDEDEFKRCLDHIATFERTLADDGALILKFWMHLSHSAQKRRLESLQNDPMQQWQVTPEDWKHWEMYDTFIAAAKQLIARTSTGSAPWVIVEGRNHNFRSLQVGETIRDAATRHLAASQRSAELVETVQDSLRQPAEEPDRALESAGEALQKPRVLTVLDTIDMTRRLSKKSYNKAMKRYSGELNALHRAARQRDISTILVFEGPDAAGKGGAIRRMATGLDAPNYRVMPIAAPTDGEDRYHYLWRFWRRLPRAGKIRIFDRSWYGRVLVERVENFATPEEWGRAYSEINEFEAQLVEHRIILLKFWIHITREEQLARFQAREQTPHKQWKLGPEDWRNREKWELYDLAAHDMVQQTSTLIAPWILVPGNHKPYARVEVIRSVCETMAAALEK